MQAVTWGVKISYSGVTLLGGSGDGQSMGNTNSANDDCPFKSITLIATAPMTRVFGRRA